MLLIQLILLKFITPDCESPGPRAHQFILANSSSYIQQKSLPKLVDIVHPFHLFSINKTHQFQIERSCVRWYKPKQIMSILNKSAVFI